MFRSHMFVLVSALTLIALSTFGCAGSPKADPAMEEHIINHEVSPQDIAAAKSTEPVKADSVMLWVNGMGCPLCASNIDRQLERLSGVTKVNVDLGQGVVALTFKPNAAHPSPARIGEAVEDAGFTLVKVVQP